MTNGYVWPLVIVLGMMLTSVTVLLALHIDAAMVLLVVTSIVTPVVSAMTWTLSHQVKGEVEKVKKLVNGKEDHEHAL